MRSGWHEEFEAHLAVSRVRAERTEALRRMARAVRPFAEVYVRFGVNARQAVESIARAQRALEQAAKPASGLERHLAELARTRRRLP